MKHKIKMIGMDLDGTLLATDKRLTDRTKKALQDAVRQGIVVLPATGRPLCGLPKDLTAMDGIRYAVTANGARVLDMKEEKVIDEMLLPVEAARKILDVLEQYDTLREIYYDGVGFAQEDAMAHIERYLEEPAMAKYVRATRTPVSNIREKFEQENRDVDKVQGVFSNMEERALAMEELRKIPGLAITGALRKNIEINRENVNKGNALIRLGEHLGIHREEILTFGDSSNDLDMIRMTGVGVAMKNSRQEILDVADYITASNDEDGVAAFIETYILDK